MWLIDRDNQLTKLPVAKPGSQVWVPSDALVAHQVSLPLNRRHAWAKLAPFALEEKLIGDIDNFHFVIGLAQEDGQVPVLVLAKEKMNAWLDILAEHSIQPEKIWPDVLAVPYDKQGSVLWHEGGHCLLRLDEQTGLSGSLEWISAALRVRSDSLTKIKVYSDAIEKLPEFLRKDAESLPRPLAECMTELPRLPASSMNFLQGPYRLTSPLKIWFYPWFKAAAAALTAMSFYLITVFMQTQMIDNQQVQLRQSVNRFFQNNFPSGDVRDMRPSVRSLIEYLELNVNAMSVNPWLVLLRVDGILSQCKECRVEKINLNEEFVSLEISSSESFDSILPRLEEIEDLKKDIRSLEDLSEDGLSRKRLSFEFRVKKT